jgi:hypothetical protein
VTLFGIKIVRLKFKSRNNNHAPFQMGGEQTRGPDGKYHMIMGGNVGGQENNTGLVQTIGSDGLGASSWFRMTQARSGRQKHPKARYDWQARLGNKRAAGVKAPETIVGDSTPKETRLGEARAVQTSNQQSNQRKKMWQR